MIMRRTFFILVLAACSVFMAAAQDKIYFVDSSVVDAVVDEIGDELIYYRLFSNQHGPVYSTTRYNVTKIVYDNGYEQIFGAPLLSPVLPEMAAIDGHAMRYYRGKLYLGSQSYYGEMQADYIAFNLYGDEYFKANRRRTTGITLITLGAAVFASAFCVPEIEGAVLLMAVGAGGLGSGIPILCSGNRMLKSIAADYNANHAVRKQPSLTLGACNNGIGLALNF